MLGDDGTVLVVAECKAAYVPLNGPVERQATEYAVKATAPFIWISNGNRHRFFVRKSKGGGYRRTSCRRYA